MHRKSRGARSLRFESLENRALLAGDVTVSVVNHNLIVHGDNGDDNITIEAKSDGTVRISGSNGTTINGQSADFTTASIKNLSVVMGDGNDTVSVSGYAPDTPSVIGLTVFTLTPLAAPLPIAGSASIVLGNGNDTVNFWNTNISGGLSIHAGNGNDALNVESSVVHGNVDIHAGDGDDTVFLRGPLLVPSAVFIPTTIVGPVPFSPILHPGIATTATSLPVTSQQFEGNVSIALGKGSDSVAIDYTSIAGNLTLSAGAGRDVIDVGRPLVITYNIGDGSISSGGFADVTIGGILSIIGGGGGDQVTLNTLKARIIDVVTGQGADNVSLASVTADALFAALGAGDDTLDASNGNNSIKNLIAFGNAGQNSFRDATTNHFPHKFLFGFDSTG